MDKSLLDKEVLCIFDTRQIQRYIFRSNSYYDILGASDLVNDILFEAIEFALANIDTPLHDGEFDLSTDPDAESIPYFTDENIKFQLIICAAGNAMCIVRTGALAKKIIRKISRYYLDHGCTLNFAAAAAEKTGNMAADIFSLYKKLDKVKASPDSSEPLGALSVVMKESKTGDPVIGTDAVYGDHISMTSLLKRKKLGKRMMINRMEDMHTTTGADGKDYLAVIHADGNNLGITIGRILQNAEGYEQSIRIRRRISRSIITLYDTVMKNTLEQLKTIYESRGGSGDFDREFLVIHQAGDDVNCICSAGIAFDFIDVFFRNLEGAYIWQSDGLSVPLYVCAGISFVTPETTFAAAFELAEKCCKSAKTEAKKEKNLKDGLAVNWIDFQVCGESDSQELDMLRQRYYVTGEGIDLLMRPYRIGSDGERSLEVLKERSRAFRGLSLSPIQEKIMRQTYTIGRLEFNQWVEMMKRRGVDLAALLGGPMYMDDDQITHSAWFDAAEISEFVR